MGDERSGDLETARANDLARWYEARARDFLLEHAPAKLVEELDADLVRLRAVQARVHEELDVCFLGVSGIGKSTLINALVAGKDVIVPSGGIGPLTALAMQVRHGAEPSLTAQYHKRGDLSRLLFVLEEAHKKRQRVGQPDIELPADLERPADLADFADVVEPSTEAAAGAGLSDVLASLRKQAQLLVTGNQNDQDPIEYILDSIREVLGRDRAWRTLARPVDADRLGRLRVALEKSAAESLHALKENGDRAAFIHDLHLHASGHLSPLIRELTVYWTAPLLETGVVLVDLPGVGISGDIYREVTQKWIREKARAVVLVVNHRGIDEANADLLRTSGFLTRLLFSVDDPAADPVVLAVAVTQLDLVADSRYQQDKTRKKADHLEDCGREAIALLRTQLREQLESVWSSSGDSLSSGKQEVVERLVESVEIYPVSALEYRRLLAGDEEDRAFIRNVEESGVPQLQRGLTAIADTWRSRGLRDLREANDAFRGRVMTNVRLIEAEWQGDNHAVAEAEKLHQDLEAFVQPLKREFDSRRGAFREFLRSGISDKVDVLVAEATGIARRDITSYLRDLKSAHWATLKAATVRGGTFHGSRRINLPDDFSQQFVEPIGEAWGKQLLRDIRTRTKEFADDCVSQVEELVEWCRSNGAKVQPRLLDAQLEAIRADARQVALIGKDVIADLRSEVKNNLIESIRAPIKKRCDVFVRNGDAMGPGVKMRMLELFDELAASSCDEAKKVARQVLLRNFRKVEEELRSAMSRFDDPLDAAVLAIVSSTEQRLKRADNQQRAAVLEAARALQDTCPRWNASD